MESAEQKYRAILEQCPDDCVCGIAVTFPDGRVFAMFEQNGGFSSLFDAAGNELYEVSREGVIYDEDEQGTYIEIISFDEVICDPHILAPWLTRNEDGDVIERDGS